MAISLASSTLLRQLTVSQVFKIEDVYIKNAKYVTIEKQAIRLY